MQLQTWKIQGRVFHFGEHGIGLEGSRITWGSDSLFAALVARLAALRGAEAVKSWLGTPAAPQKPPFALTSTFPYAGDVRFFPVPKAALRVRENEFPPDIRPKDLKRVRFVSEGIYRALIRGQSLLEVWQTNDVVSLHHKTVWLLKSEVFHLPPSGQHKQKNCTQQIQRTFWTTGKRPRVAVGRAPNNSNLFHVGAVRFAEGCGLWFGVQWLTEDKATRTQFTNLLKDLSDAGLGAERSSGYGQAQISEDAALEFPDPNRGAWTTLSRYLPAEDEIPALTHPAAAYEIERVGGWMDARGLRRIPANLLAEGAVLGPLDKPAPYGSIVDVRPVPSNESDFAPVPHPVWRSGVAVAIGYRGGTP